MSGYCTRKSLIIYFESLFNTNWRTLGIYCWTDTELMPSQSWWSGAQNTPPPHAQGSAGEILHITWPVFSVPANVTFDQGLGGGGGSRSNPKVQWSRRGPGPKYKSQIKIFRSLPLAGEGGAFSTGAGTPSVTLYVTVSKCHVLA